MKCFAQTVVVFQKLQNNSDFSTYNYTILSKSFITSRGILSKLLSRIMDQVIYHLKRLFNLNTVQ